MKKIFLLLLAAGSLGMASAQTYKHVFYKPQTVESNDIKITVEDAVASDGGIKFKLRIFNKTSNYIVYKPSESTFKIDGKEGHPDEKWLVIRPNDDESRVINLKGNGYAVTRNFDYVMSGLYTFSIDAKGVNTPDFQLPPSQNDIKAGGFNISMVKNKKTTARTDATFKASYVGDKIGIFEPNKVAMKMKDGKEYANYHSDKKPIVFDKGQEQTVEVSWKDIPSSSGDMQKETMTILWRDAFKEITPDKMMPQTLTIMYDEDVTKSKN